ncbi:hypothetical protein MC885_017166 [Smutsia gigantea]|nr:hypothetical protein MC885_017166 [Smutsia gigantea]
MHPQMAKQCYRALPGRTPAKASDPQHLPIGNWVGVTLTTPGDVTQQKRTERFRMRKSEPLLLRLFTWPRDKSPGDSGYYSTPADDARFSLAQPPGPPYYFCTWRSLDSLRASSKRLLPVM